MTDKSAEVLKRGCTGDLVRLRPSVVASGGETLYDTNRCFFTKIVPESRAHDDSIDGQNIEGLLYCSGKVSRNTSHFSAFRMEGLLQQLIDQGYLKTPGILDAFRTVEREDFLPSHQRPAARENIPLYIGYGQTISQPLTVAFMLELLQPKPGEKILDIGAGSGWAAALLASLVGPAGKVIAIERIPQLYQFAKQNLEKYRFPHLRLLRADASLGYAKEAPYDVIHVAAGAPEVPQPLLDQLAEGGRLLIPIGNDTQTLTLFTKGKNGDIAVQKHPGFAFVPLIQG